MYILFALRLSVCVCVCESRPAETDGQNAVSTEEEGGLG